MQPLTAQPPPRSATTSGRPSLEEVAAVAGVSRATVSRVVNGSPTVAAELRERVEQAVAQVGYQPNRAARALVTKRTDAIALVASEPGDRVFTDPYFSAIVRGVSYEAAAAGVQVVLLLAQQGEDLARIETYVRSGAVDGVLLISEHASADPVPAALMRAGIPVVLGGRPIEPGLALPYVDNDNVVGARLAVERLLGGGRTVIGTLAGPQDMCAGIDRLDGFREALGPWHEESRVEIADFTAAGGEAATARLLDRVPALDGLFAASDLMALGALRALRRAGRRVPQDVAVVGFDDIDSAATADPPLTTVRQETLLQGRAMVRLLLARTRPDLALPAAPGIPDRAGADHLVLPVELVARESA